MQVRFPTAIDANNRCETNGGRYHQTMAGNKKTSEYSPIDQGDSIFQTSEELRQAVSGLSVPLALS